MNLKTKGKKTCRVKSCLYIIQSYCNMFLVCFWKTNLIQFYIKILTRYDKKTVGKISLE